MTDTAPRARRPRFTIAVAFAAVGLAFLAASGTTVASIMEIDREVADLDTNSLPSVGSLSRARTAVDRLRTDLSALPTSPAPAHGALVEDVARARADLDADLATYSATGWYPGEQEMFQGRMRPQLARLEGDVDDLLALDGRGDGGAVPDLEQRVHADCDEADDTLADLHDLNLRQSVAASTRIARLRQRSVRTAFLLEGASMLVAFLAAWLAQRSERRLEAVLLENAALQGSRADELETFAQRVAHDLLNPLSAVSFSLGTLAKRHRDAETAGLVDRMRQALERQRRMVTGIFDFARSGARPVGGSRAALAETLRAARDDVLAAYPAGPPSITIEPFDDVEVGCDAAVLGAILLNLLGNAAKFTQDQPVRRVVVRARSAGDRVRVEVEDSGAGPPAGLETTIFEPYVRGPGVTPPGLGLGLATVRRFVTAHGGAVGVERGALGACFWFEMPLATPTAGKT